MTTFPSSILQQYKLFYGKNNFEVKSGSYISVEQSKNSRKPKFVIDLMALSPDSRVQLNLAWNWMVAMVISIIALALVFTVSQFIRDTAILEYIHYLIAVLGSLFIVFTMLFSTFSNRKRIFMTRHSKLPIIEILISNPNKNSYNSFVDSLENEIIISSQNRQLNQNQQRAGELKTLRRLSQQGVISRDEYEECKHLLLHA